MEIAFENQFYCAGLILLYSQHSVLFLLHCILVCYVGILPLAYLSFMTFIISWLLFLLCILTRLTSFLSANLFVDLCSVFDHKTTKSNHISVATV